MRLQPCHLAGALLLEALATGARVDAQNLPPVTARFDHVRFGPTGTTPVTLQSFSVE